MLKEYEAQTNKEGFKRCPLIFGVSLVTAPIFAEYGKPNAILAFNITAEDPGGKIVLIRHGNARNLGRTLAEVAAECDGLPIFYFENLSHDYFFIKDILNSHFGAPINKFFMNRRSPLFLRFREFEIRDAVALAGCKLKKWAEDLNVTTNEFLIDYTAPRGERLNAADVEIYEIKRAANNARAVADCVRITINNNYNYFNLPLTYTGFVRQAIQKAGYKAHNAIEEMAADYDTFIKLTKAKAGGYVNAAAWAIGRTLYNIDAYDGTSAYLYSMLVYGYPMAKFLKIKINDWEVLKRKISTHAFLMLVELEGGEIKENVYFPYISQNAAEEYELNGEIDTATAGGKITRFKRVKLWLTELDLLIIERVYNISKISVLEAHAAKKNLLPDYIRKEILKRYREKEEAGLKIPFDEVAYNMKKSHLNAIPGIMGEVPIKDVSGDGKRLNDDEKRRLYGAKITSKRNVTNYAWALWVTAYQRYFLFDVGLKLGLCWLYSDTDSFFVDDHKKAEAVINSINARSFEKLSKLYPLDFYDANLDFIGKIKHKTHYKRFKVLGPKKYGGETEEGLKITVAGVNKQNGVKALKGDFKNFKTGLTFSAAEAGRTLTNFIDAKDLDTETKKEMIKRGFPILSSIDTEPAKFKIYKEYSETPEEFILFAAEALADIGTYGLQNE